MRPFIKNLGVVALTAFVSDMGCADDIERAWRVVVQDAQVEPLAVAADGQLVIGREPRAPHVLHVVDIPSARVVLTANLPGHVLHTAATPDGEIIAVSTGDSSRRGGVYLIRLDDGMVRLIIKDASGALAIDNSGQHLAVLGNVPDFQAGVNNRRSSRGGSSIGVYDIAAGKWLAKASTPIVIPRHVAFDGATAVGFGTGGNPYHMIPRTFSCDTTLDPVAGTASTKRGPTSARGRPAKPEETQEQPYGAPAFVAKREQEVSEASKRLSQIQAKLTLSKVRNPKSPGFAAIGGPDRIRFLAKCWLDEPRGWHIATFNVTRQGNLSVTEPVAGHAFQACGDRFLAITAQEREGKLLIREAEAGDTIMEIPWKPLLTAPGLYQYHLAPGWVLTWAVDDIDFYPLSDRQKKRHMSLHGVLWPPSIALDYSYLVFPCEVGREKLRMEVVDPSTAESAWSVEVDRGPNRGSYDVALNSHSLRLAVLLAQQSHLHVVHVYDLCNGERELESKVPDRYAFQIASARGGRWLVSTEGGWRVLSSDGQWAGPIDHRGWDLTRAKPLPLRDVDWILVETDRSQGILDLHHNAVVDKWVAGGPSAIAFDGRILVRSAAYLGNVDFLNLKTMERLFTLHPLPVGNRFGWIATTPDGYWDASLGAEEHIAVFQGRKLASQEAARARRRPGLIREALASLQSDT